MDKCRFCGLRGLVLSTACADYSCEHCGEWQGAILNSAWLIVGYEETTCDECGEAHDLDNEVMSIKEEGASV
jgi:hypothetical protein